MDNSNNQSQFRFLIAAVLSMIVLFGWSYLYSPTKPVENANTAVNANVAQTAPVQATPVQQSPQPVPEIIAATPDTVPARSITIKSPLYEVTLDSKGALATSWILLKNKLGNNEFPLYADGSNAEQNQPLQLISEEALKQTPRAVPFRLTAGDQNLDALLNDRNYQISVPEEAITLAEGQEKQIDFTLTDASGVEVKKSFVFRGDSYISDLGVSVRRNGQTVTNTKLLIGASIGDHAINNHNFYHIESEAVAAQFRSETSKLAHVPSVPSLEPLDERRLPSRGLVSASIAIVVLIIAGLSAWGAGLFDPAAPAPELVTEAPPGEPVLPEAAPAGDVGLAAAVPGAPVSDPGVMPGAMPVQGVPVTTSPAAGGPVVLTATEDVWIKIYDKASRQSAKIGILKAGESFAVPTDAPGLQLWTGKAGALAVTVNGKPIPPLGGPVQTVRDVSLAANDLLARAAPAAAPAVRPGV